MNCKKEKESLRTEISQAHLLDINFQLSTE